MKDNFPDVKIYIPFSLFNSINSAVKDLNLDGNTAIDLLKHIQISMNLQNNSNEKEISNEENNKININYIIPDIPMAIEKEAEFNIPMIDSEPNKLFQYFHWIGSLKKTKRTGWILEGISYIKSESIADHMYRMAMMALSIKSNGNLDLSKCIKMCLVHDAAEAMVGDIPPSANIPKSQKHEEELNAIRKLKSLIMNGTDFMNLWNEYENQSSPEAILVKDLDRFEMIFQALEYELEEGVNLQCFFDATKGFFKTEIVKEWSKELLKCRKTILNRE